MASFGRSIVEAVHRLQHVIRHFSIGAMLSALTDGPGHIGNTDTAVIVGISMSQRDFLPLMLPTRRSFTVPPKPFGSGTSSEPALP